MDTDSYKFLFERWLHQVLDLDTTKESLTLIDPLFSRGEAPTSRPVQDSWKDTYLTLFMTLFMSKPKVRIHLQYLDIFEEHAGSKTDYYYTIKIGFTKDDQVVPNCSGFDPTTRSMYYNIGGYLCAGGSITERILIKSNRNIGTFTRIVNAPIVVPVTIQPPG